MYNVKNECHGATCSKCGGELEHDPQMKTYFCTECGEIDDSLNTQSTWQGSFGGAGVIANERGDVKSGLGKKWSTATYQSRQRKKLRDKLGEAAHCLGFSERHMNEVMSNLDSFYKKWANPLQSEQLKTRYKKVPVFKTLGANQACQKACCVIMYLVARKNRMAISLPEICIAWNLQTIQVGQILRCIEHVQNLTSPPIPPEKYLPRVLSRLRVVRIEQSVRILDFSLDPEAEKLTEEEVNDLQEKSEKLLMIADSAFAISGRSPIALACAVMHLACDASKMCLAQNILCRKYEITESNLSKRVRETKAQLCDLVKEQTGADLTNLTNGSTLGWLVEHSATLIKLKNARNSKGANSKEDASLKRRLDSDFPPPKRKKRSFKVTMKRQCVVAQAYIELKEDGADIATIPAFEDEEKMKVMFPRDKRGKIKKPPTRTEVRHAKTLLQMKMDPMEIVHSDQTFLQLVKEQQRKQKVAAPADNSDGSELDDGDDSDLDQYFRDDGDVTIKGEVV